MIESMTGFGTAIFELKDLRLSVEIKSLNSKQLDLNFRIPSIYKEEEMHLRKKISQHLQRGKIDCTFSKESLSSKSHKINKEVVEGYIDELKKISPKGKKMQYLKMALRMPEVFERFSEDEIIDEKNKLSRLLEEALEKIKKNRQEEGRIIKEEFVLRISSILNYLKQIDSLEKERKNAVKEKFKNAFEEFPKIDENRFEQELIYYYEKLDISEEKSRLRFHCNYFLDILEESISKGKKLGFISQEISREINTLGSKSLHASMQKCVVLMKEELEKIKEQICNVL